MKRRNCPECGETNYSANYSAEYWKCHTCGAKINIEFQHDTDPRREGVSNNEEL